MTCAELAELAGAYALGALEPAERAAVEAHLAEPGPHQGCPEAVARARATVVALSRALPEVRPGPEVWRAIEARAGGATGTRGDGAAEAREGGGTEGRAPPRRWIGPAGWAAAAAAVLALVLLQRAHQESARHLEASGRAAERAEVAEAERERLAATLQALAGAEALQREALSLLDRPGTRLVPLEPVAGQAGRAVAIVNLAEGRAVIASSSLPAQAGKTYQLWVIRGTAPPRPAGFLSSLAGAASAGEVEPSLLGGVPPDALAVSLEPAGGSPQPTQVVLLGRLGG